MSCGCMRWLQALFAWGLVTAAMSSVGLLQALPQQSVLSQQELKELGVFLGQKHIVIVEPTQNAIFMTYFFGVHNSYGKPHLSAIPLFYPQDVHGIEPIAGVHERHIVFQNKRFYVKKYFDPGHTVVTLRYSVPYEGGKTQSVEFSEVDDDLVQVAFLRQKRAPFLMTIQGFMPGVPAVLDSGNFVGQISKKALAKNTVLTLGLAGLPQRKWRYDVLGLVFAWVLFGISIVALLRMKRGAR